MPDREPLFVEVETGDGTRFISLHHVVLVERRGADRVITFEGGRELVLTDDEAEPLVEAIRSLRDRGE